MNKPPRDIIDEVQKIAAEAGNIAALDDDYYECLINLSDPQIEKLVVAMMVDKENEVRRISAGVVDAHSIDGVTAFVHKGIKVIGLGLMMFGPFGTMQMYARVGGPSSELLELKVENAIREMEPVIWRTVASNLSWILSRTRH